VTGKQNICQKLLVEKFNTQFTGMDLAVLWTSLLDPQFGLEPTHWKIDQEKEIAKIHLIAKVTNLE
jgi:hypothetical protein